LMWVFDGAAGGRPNSAQRHQSAPAPPHGAGRRKSGRWPISWPTARLHDRAAVWRLSGLGGPEFSRGPPARPRGPGGRRRGRSPAHVQRGGHAARPVSAGTAAWAAFIWRLHMSGWSAWPRSPGMAV
jgi:hypothetical protein